MGTLLGTRRSWGWRKGGAAAGETGARIGGPMAAGSGAAKPPSQPSVGAGRAGDLGRTELWPLRAVHISAGGGGELYIAMPAGRTACPQAAAGPPIANLYTQVPLPATNELRSFTNGNRVKLLEGNLQGSTAVLQHTDSRRPLQKEVQPPPPTG